MEDDIRKDLKLLCYEILENVKTESLTEQLTHVQMLYERLLVLNYLNENPDKLKQPTPQSPDTGVTSPPQAEGKAPKARESLHTEPRLQEPEPTERPDPTPASQGESPSPAPAQEAPPPKEAPEASAPPPPAEEVHWAPEPQAPNPEQKDSPASQEHRDSAPSQPPESEQPAPPKEPEEKSAQQEASPSPKPSSYNVPPPGYEQKRSLNDRLAKGSIDIGLNDRLAFVKHLFGGAQEDFNRVLSQLNTFTSLREAEDFLDQVVKPEYDWSEKEEYEERLRLLLRKRYGEEDSP